jgi:hypothetical protein
MKAKRTPRSVSGITLRLGLGPAAGGVSAGLFCAVANYLRREYRGQGRLVSTVILNRWIALLGHIEREYRELARRSRKPKGIKR